MQGPYSMHISEQKYEWVRHPLGVISENYEKHDDD